MAVIEEEIDAVFLELDWGRAELRKLFAGPEFLKRHFKATGSSCSGESCGGDDAGFLGEAFQRLERLRDFL